MRPEHWLFTIPLRLRSLFRWAQADQELDDELRDHLERKTEEYVAQGMTQEEAHRRVRIDLHGIEQTKEKCRDARQVNYIENFMQDFGSQCGLYVEVLSCRPLPFFRWELRLELIQHSSVSWTPCCPALYRFRNPNNWFF